jgi:hypothetical protein
MKQHLLIISALVMLGVLLALATFTKGSSASLAMQDPGGINTTITLTPNPVQLGNPVVVKGKVDNFSAKPSANNGTIKIYHLADKDGKPVACGTEGAIKLQDGSKDLTAADGGIYSVAVPTGFGPFTTKGNFGFQIDYFLQGKDSGLVKSSTACMDLMIVNAPTSLSENCDQPIAITSDFVTGSGNPCPGTSQIWSVNVKVCACQSEALSGVKAQGDTAAGLSVIAGGIFSQGSLNVVKTNQNNSSAWVWDIGYLPAGQCAKLTFAETGKVSRQNEVIGGLLGEWSVKGTLGSNGTIIHTTHTPKVTFRTDSDNCR